jgi:histone deacetylase complex regulatory component SIN3
MITRSHTKSVGFVIAAAVALGAMSMTVQKANAEPQPSVVSTKTSAHLKSKDRVRASRAHRGNAPIHTAAPTPTTGASTEPVFLSDAWLKQEKQTDDRLRRFMNICKGC